MIQYNNTLTLILNVNREEQSSVVISFSLIRLALIPESIKTLDMVIKILNTPIVPKSAGDIYRARSNIKNNCITCVDILDIIAQMYTTIDLATIILT